MSSLLNPSPIKELVLFPPVVILVSKTCPTWSKYNQIIMVSTSRLKKKRPFNTVLLQNLPELPLHPA